MKNESNSQRQDTDATGIPYENDDNLLVLGKKRDFGLFLKTAPLTIYKRGGFGDYAQWLEIFGMPQRVGKYSSYDVESRQLLTQALEQAGSAPYIVIPKESEVETTNNTGNGSSGTSYNDFRKACNEETLITILGQTLTTIAGDKGARSLGEVHQDVAANKYKSDIRFVGSVLNHSLLPILERRGFKVKGGKFVFPEDTEPLTVDEIIKLSKIISIPTLFLHDKYGIPVPSSSESIAGQATQTPVEQEETKPEEPEKPKRNKKKKLIDFFAFAPTQERGRVNFATRLIDNITNRVRLSDKYTIDIKSILQEALDEIYDNEVSNRKQPLVSHRLFNITNKALQEAVDSVFEPEFGKKNKEFLAEFKHNTAVFSAFKNHQQTKEIVAMLYDEDGNLRSFREFKKEALKISKDYNVSWLQTEYNTAVRAARAAANFRKYLETEHLYPNLEYIESTASKKRESHLDYVGTILPIHHKWWDTHMPPSDWNCACSVRPTDKEGTPVPGEELVPPTFQNNPGKTAEFVKIKETPYYKHTEKEIREVIQNIATELEEEVTEKRFKSGGLIQTPVNFKQNQNEEKKNIIAYTHLAKNYGEKYRLLSIINKRGVKNPDAYNLVKMCYSDAKIPISVSGKNAIQNSIKSASKQRVQEAYIYLTQNYPMQEVWEGLKVALQNGRAESIEEIIIAFKDGEVKRYNVSKIRKIFNRK